MFQFLTTLRCVDAYGASALFDVYEVQEAGSTARRTFHVVCAGTSLDGMAEIFLFVLKMETPQTAFVLAANHYLNESVRAKGIPDALLPFLKVQLGLNIRSSTGLAHEEWRTKSATNYWRRLEVEGLARYDPEKDIFWLL